MKHSNKVICVNTLKHLNKVKGHLLCKIHFYMVFGHICVLTVCEHNHPTMIKIHRLLIFKIPFKPSQSH